MIILSTSCFVKFHNWYESLTFFPNSLDCSTWLSVELFCILGLCSNLITALILYGFLLQNVNTGNVREALCTTRTFTLTGTLRYNITRLHNWLIMSPRHMKIMITHMNFRTFGEFGSNTAGTPMTLISFNVLHFLHRLMDLKRQEVANIILFEKKKRIFV